MSTNLSPYSNPTHRGKDNRHLFGNNDEVVIAPTASKAHIVLSPPLSRSPSPFIRRSQPHDEVEPRILGQKTLEFFGNPFRRSTYDTSLPTPIHERRPSSPKSDASSSASSACDPGRPPSPIRPDSVTHNFFFKEHAPPPAESPPPRTGLLKIPKLERFFPSRVGRQGEDRTRPDIGGYSDHGPGYFDPSCDYILVDPEYNTVQPPMPSELPSLTFDTEPVSSPEPSLRDFVMLDDLPSMLSSPVPSSPVSESPPPLTPTQTSTPDSPTPKAEKPQNEVLADLCLESQNVGPIVFAEGVIIGREVPLQLISLLGIGAFSNVWLARDVLRKLEHPGDRPKTDIIKKRAELERRRGDRTAHGLRSPMGSSAGCALGRSASVYLKAKGAVAANEENPMTQGDLDHGRLVALKIMDRALCDTDDRTRISFMREVEILRHISHPSIVSYLYSFSTPSHHCLVLEALRGGELFDLMSQDENYSRMTEPLVRRIFGELCQAVGWMHSVNLVHRDVKLENILFTTNPFASGAILPPSTHPLVKLTDFGLARFIDPTEPVLTTRCGSESYAAPEIIMCRPYDGRQTDAWACGVLLYALVTCRLPFDKPSGTDTRRAFLSRIARAGYSWPVDAPLVTDSLKTVVQRFLVRDPAKRASVPEIWEEPWMLGEGAPPPPIEDGKLVGGEVPSVAREEPI